MHLKNLTVSPAACDVAVKFDHGDVESSPDAMIFFFQVYLEGLKFGSRARNNRTHVDLDRDNFHYSL